MKFLGNRWVRYVLTIALVLLVVFKIHPERLVRAVASANGRFMLFALVLTLPFLYLKALRWHVMLRAGGIDATFRESAVSLLGGMGIALLTPARLGELVRVAYLRDKQKLKIGGLVMIDKGFDVTVLAAFSSIGAWRLLGPAAGVALAVAALAGLFVVYFPRAVERPLAALAIRLPFGVKLERILSSSQSLSPRVTTVFLALTVASFALVFLQFGVILLSWRSWSLDIVLLTFPLVILTNILPVTIGGLGLREGTAALLLAHYGVSSADAAVTALLSSTVNTYLPGLAGALLFPLSAGRPAAGGVQPLEET